MEPRPDEKKDQEPRPGAQPANPRRFRIVKLEERIAPSSASTHGKCLSGGHTACCY
jgi:hypothetical protein